MGRKAVTEEIEIAAADGVQVIRFLRPEKKNAFTGPMYAAMSEALEAAETDDAIAAHVFIGSGGVFSAGNDINDFLRRAQAAGRRGRPGYPGAVARLHSPPAQGDQADDRRRGRPRHRRRRHHAPPLRPDLRHARRQPAHALPRPRPHPGGRLQPHRAGPARLSARLRADLPGRAVQRRARPRIRAHQRRRSRPTGWRPRHLPPQCGSPPSRARRSCCRAGCCARASPTSAR